jgi:hypothetical protein
MTSVVSPPSSSAAVAPSEGASPKIETSSTLAVPLKGTPHGSSPSVTKPTLGPVEDNSDATTHANSDEEGTSRTSEDMDVEVELLPTARELSRLLLALTNDDDDSKVSIDDAIYTLRSVDHWGATATGRGGASCLADRSNDANITFMKDFAELGGIRIILHFMEDHLNESVPVMFCVKAIGSILRPLDAETVEAGTNNEPNEMDQKLAKIKNKLVKKFIDHEGIELLMRAFEIHTMSSVSIVSTASRNKSSEELVVKTDSWKASTASFWQRLVEGTQREVDMDYWMVDGDMNEPVFDDFVMSLFGMNIEVSVDGIFEHVHDRPRDVSGVEVATPIVEVLTIVIPYVNVVPTSNIVACLCNAVPTLLRKTTVNEEGTPSAADATLMLEIITCLVTATADMEEVDKDTKQTLLMLVDIDPKKIVGATVLIMKRYPQHDAIVAGGCVILKELTPLIPSVADKRKLGVVSVLGTVLESDEIDPEVRDVADTILTAQLQDKVKTSRLLTAKNPMVRHRSSFV